jgi:glycosyltransferase involved in cell wall biosynthesis
MRMLAWSRRIWAIRRLAMLRHPRGFQYSPSFTKQALKQWPTICDGDCVLTWHPFIVPHEIIETGRLYLYLDCSQRQVFDHYSTSVHSHSLKLEALKRETNIFRHSVAIFCMSQWAADSVVNDYAIDPTKVHVVPGGANLDEHQLAQLPAMPPPPAPSAEQPLRLGFLGKEWQRKGGPFLLQLADALQQRGLPTVIRAIGPDPAQLPAHPALQPLGFINKQGDTARFVAELRSWHFGTLFSDAEAFGISNRECLRLGVHVLAHAVGGIPSTLPDAGCGQLFAGHPSAATVADWIAARLTPYEGYLAWRAALAPRWREFTWDAAVEQLAAIFHSS